MIAARIVKSVMVATVGLFGCMVAYNNCVDYDSNRAFVQHVLAMDTVFPFNAVKGRAITSPAVQRAAYAAIIAIEWIAGLLCLYGAYALLRARSDGRAFNAAKTAPLIGLLLLWLLYYVGFVIVGGEWFTMWQSSVWNGQQKAVMFVTCSTLVLIVLLLPEGDDAR